MNTCISTWNYWKSLQAEARLYPILEAIKEQGFGIELWLDWTFEPDLLEPSRWPELKRACRNNVGLSLHSRLIHRFDLETIKEEIDLCRYLEADPLVIHPRSLGLNAGSWDARMKQSPSYAELAVIAEILSYSGERSVRLALENGSMELLRSVLAACRSHLHSDCLGVCIDTGHANLHHDLYPNPALEFLSAFQDRLLHLHFSDNYGAGDEHRSPGEGSVDWPAVMSKLKQLEYRGKIVLELFTPRPAEAGVGAAAFLEKIGRQAAEGEMPNSAEPPG